MSNNLLLKGFEVELFTGLINGQHVGVASEVVKDLKEFVKEPDQRNLEYITAPESQYSMLKEALLAPRRRLRKWLEPQNLTIFPFSTLSLGDSNKFERSDPMNPYHEFIEVTYGTKVVTTSVHVNLGIKDLPFLFSALRLVRCEAALLLALSASSPFLDGKPTGAHSQRWIQFPLTPKNVPIFLNHEHYVHWVEDQLSKSIMQNERHLWTSVRPNGSNRPYELNRLELRIFDLIEDVDLLLALTALLELRVLSLGNNPEKFDPLLVSKFNSDQLASLCDQNDAESARNSLDATLLHWRDGKTICCRDWIEQLLEDVKPLASELKMLHMLEPIFSVLENGNQSMKWLGAYSQGQSMDDLLKESIVQMQEKETITNPREVMLG